MNLAKRILNSILSHIPESNRAELIWKLAQVDFKKRYYHDKLGLFWALLDPVLKVMTYYIAFQFIKGREGTGIDNFALFLFSAIIFWKFFGECLRKSLQLIRKNKSLLQSIQINVFDLYYAMLISNLLGLLFNLSAYFLVASIMGAKWSFAVLLLIPLIFNIVLLTAGLSMIAGTIYTYFNDIKHLIVVALLFGLWTSGVFFKASAVLDIWPAFYYINPFIGMFENIRHVALYDTPLNVHIFWINLIYALVIAIIGWVFLAKNRYSFLENL